jgi:hypothetical protein
MKPVSATESTASIAPDESRDSKPPDGSVPVARTGGIAVGRFPGKGRGVVAQRHFGAHETIERAPVLVVPAEEAPLIRQTRLANYYFEWGADCQQAAIALGCGSLYNH